tara:strand:- start:143 stop:385 length:243 start_codon:yes stop_codon:yes gene_type:complete
MTSTFKFPNPKEFNGISKLSFYKRLILDEIYEVELKKAGFDEWGQPKSNCPNPDIEPEELEQRAWDTYKKEGVYALPDDI